MSWRDSTPQQVQDDLDLLAHESLAAATTFLEKNGEFFPFGFRLPPEGGPEMVAADPGEGEQPLSLAVLDLLYDAVSALREGTRATAVTSAVETSEGDAIRVEVEHRDGGPALALLLPYCRRGLRRRFEYGHLTAQAGRRRVWDGPP